MSREGQLLRFAILAVAIIDLFAFSSMTAAVLFLMSVGIVCAVFSFLLEDRFLALLAVAILGAEAALSLRIESVLEIRMLLSAALGIFLPLLAVGIILFRQKMEPGAKKPSDKRYVYLTLAIICVCLLAVPIASVLLGILAITILMHISTLIEIAIIIVAIVLCTAIGTMIRPRKNRMKMEGTEVG